GSPYDIVPSNAVGTGLGNYAITYKNGKLTVVPSPPTIVSATPSLASLWPANHRMVPITIAVVATSLADPTPVCTIDGGSSSEPLDADGDWVVTPGSLSLALRAERLGAGTGRVYTITIRCTDRFGNAATKITTVSVPHDQGK